MKRNIYALIFLTFWTQVDDHVLAPASAIPPASLASETDDEFPPLTRVAQDEHIAPRRLPQPFVTKPLTDNLPFIDQGVFSEPRLATFSPTPLYVFFMSLQI